MDTNQAALNSREPQALAGTDLSDGYRCSPGSSSDISDADSETRHGDSYSIFYEDRQQSESSCEFKSESEVSTEFRSDSRDSVNFKSPSLSATELKFQSQSSTEFRSESELRSYSQCSIEFRSQSQSPTEFEFQSSETQSFISADLRSVDSDSSHFRLLEESSEYLSDTSNNDVTQNSLLISNVLPSDCQSHCSQQADTGFSRAKSAKPTIDDCIRATCHISEDFKSDSSYFGDNEGGDREWSDLKSASSCSADHTIGWGSRKPSADYETESSQSSSSLSDLEPKPWFRPVQKIDGCGDVPALPEYKEVEDPVQSTNPEMKVHPARRLPESTAHQSREDQCPYTSLESLQIKDDVKSFGIADVTSSTPAVLLEDTWAFKAEQPTNGTFQADVGDWKPCGDKDSVSTIYCDPENYSSGEDLLKHFIVASDDDLTDLDSIMPSGPEGNTSATEMSDQYLDGSTFSELDSEPMLKSRVLSNYVKCQDLSQGGALTSSISSAQGKHLDKYRLHEGHIAEDHVKVAHTYASKENSFCELKHVRLTKGATLLKTSKQSLTDEGFVSQLSAMSCNSDLSLTPQNKKTSPHLSKEHTKLTETREFPVSVVEWKECLVESDEKPEAGKHECASNKKSLNVLNPIIGGVCSSLHTAVFKPVDYNVIAQQLASSCIESAVSDLTSEWNLLVGINDAFHESSQIKNKMDCAEEDKLAKKSSPHFELLIDKFRTKTFERADKGSEGVVSSESLKVNRKQSNPGGYQMNNVLSANCPELGSSARFYWQTQSVSVYRVLPAVNNGIQTNCDTRCSQEKEVHTPPQPLQDTYSTRYSRERGFFTPPQPLQDTYSTRCSQEKEVFTPPKPLQDTYSTRCLQEKGVHTPPQPLQDTYSARCSQKRDKKPPQPLQDTYSARCSQKRNKKPPQPLQDTGYTRCSREREVSTLSQSSLWLQSENQYRCPEDTPGLNKAVGCQSQVFPQTQILSLKTNKQIKFFEIKSGRFSTYERLVPTVDQLGDLYIVDKGDKPDAEDQEKNSTPPGQTSTQKKALKPAKKASLKGTGGSRKNEPIYGIYIFRPSRCPDVTEGGICKDTSLSETLIGDIPSTEVKKNGRFKTNTEHVVNSMNEDTNGIPNVVANCTSELITQALSDIVSKPRSCQLVSVPVQPFAHSSAITNCWDEQSQLKQQVLDNAKLHLEDEMVKTILEMSTSLCNTVSSTFDLTKECAVLADRVIQKATVKLERELLSKDWAKEAHKIPIPLDSDREGTRSWQETCSTTKESSPLYLLKGPKDSSRIGFPLDCTELDNVCEANTKLSYPRASNVTIRCYGLSSSIFNLEPICTPLPQQTAVYDSRWWIQRPYLQTQPSRCPLLPGPGADSQRYRLLIEPQDYLPLDRRNLDVPPCLEDPEMQTNKECMSQLNTSTAQTRYARQYYSRKIQCSLCKGQK